MSAANALLRIASRGVATSAVRHGYKGTIPNTASYKKVQELQNVMCRDDGLLVWQKRGFRDNFMYQVTIGLVVLGFIPLTALIYSMAFPDKKN